MRRRKVDNHLERQLLIALIVSRDFLSQATPVLEQEVEKLRDLPLFYTIANWCLVFYQEYREAPKAHIETIYHSWADNDPEEDLADSVHDLLEALSDQYESASEVNVPFLLDKLSEFLSKKKLVTLQEELDGLLSRGDARSAGEAVQAYRTIEVGKTVGIDPLNDDLAWSRAFSNVQREPLITFPGDAGKFFNHTLCRDNLVAIQAPEKRGKTWWCLEFLFRALRGRKKVALFEVGDLSESQIMLRFGVRVARKPLTREFCGDVHVPQEMKRDKDEELGCSVSYSIERHKVPVNKHLVKLARAKFRRASGLPDSKPFVQFSIHSNSSINVKGISAVLDQWAAEKGFIPDVIIIDYADILAPEAREKERRDEIDERWRALRRLSQDRHALVLTATQSNASSYDAALQTMKHFSNDKRKYAHVTGMFGLNQTAEEKEASVMRLNWIVLRESPFNVKRCLYVGQCLALGKAMACATL